MAKAVKIAGAIVGVAAIIASGGLGAPLAAGLTGALGLSSGIITGAALALNVGGALLQKSPTVPSATESRLTASVNPLEYRKQVFGETAFPVDVRYEEWFGPNQDFGGWVIALASHSIESVDEIWINNELAWSAAGGVQAKFVGYFWVKHIVLEGTPDNTITITEGATSTWNTTHRLTGCAYAHLQFRVTAIGKKDNSPFSGGIPSRLTIKGKGGKVYDPRRDSTVPGGSGPMRADDQSTWRYFAEDGTPIGANLQLQALRELLGWRVQNPVTGEWVRVVGSGLAPRKIDLQSFIVAANIADEPANRSAGGSEPKYHGGCVLSEGDTPAARLDTLCAAGNSRIVDAHGKIGIRVAANDLANASLDPGLGDDDIVGPVSWEPSPGFDQIPNVARGKCVDPSNASLFQLVDYPEVRIGSPTGMDRVLPLDLAAAQSFSHAQRIVKQALQRKQYPGLFSAPFDITAWRYNVGDVVPITYSPLGFSRKLFRVVATDPRSNPVQMVLRVESATIYQWDADDTPAVMPAAPTEYDFRNSPYLLGIDRLDDAVDDANGRIDDVNGRVDGVQEVIASFTEALEEANGAIDDATSQIDQLKLVDAGAAAATRQLESARDRLNAAALQLALDANAQRQLISDAGVYVDPSDATVKIFAVQQQADRLAQAEILLNAANAQIAIRATIDFVNEAIAQAVIDPSQVAELGAIIARLNTVEINIAAILGELTLKASTETVTALGGQVSEISTTLDSVQGILTDKVDVSTFDDLSALVTSIESTLSGLGDTVGLTTTIRQARFLSDKTALAALQGQLAAEQANQGALVQLAQIQSELTTSIVDGLSAEARSRIALQAQMAGQLATVVQQLSGLVTSTSATAQALTALSARVDGVSDDLEAAVANLSQAIVDEEGARASAIETLSATVGDHTAEIADIAEVAASADGVAKAVKGFVTNVDGKVSGMRSENDGETTSITFLSDNVGFESEDGAFSWTGGNLELRDAEGNVAIFMGWRAP